MANGQFGHSISDVSPDISVPPAPLPPALRWPLIKPSAVSLRDYEVSFDRLIGLAITERHVVRLAGGGQPVVLSRRRRYNS